MGDPAPLDATTLRLLAQASDALAGSTPVDEALLRVARLTTEALADACRVDRASDEGALTRCAVVHRDPAGAGLYAALAPPACQEPVTRLVELTEGDLAPEARDAACLAAWRAQAPAAAIYVPLHARGRPLGVMTLVAEGARRFSLLDVALATELGARCAAALEIARLDEQLARARHAEAEARGRGERKDDFLALLGHELRNPLAPLRSALEVLRRAPDPALAERARGIMERQVVHMTRLLDDLLDVSRITRGKVQLRTERLALQDVVTHALELARPLLEARRHRVDVELPPEPLWVSGDQVRLEQVVANLLANAARYTPSGGNVGVALARTEQGATLRVRDDGVGIERGLLTKIFEPFTQVRPLGASSAGLGIGLTLVRELVVLHGGRVEARSSGLGHGSEFVVTLPTLDVPPGEEPRPMSSADAPPPPSALRILLVDDNEDATETLAEILRISGHEVRTAYDGTAALAAAPRFGPDVVILDIGLPDMSGHEVARALRAAGLDGAVLVGLSGFGAPEDHDRAREAGFDHYLLKPTSLAEIEALLARAVPR